MNTIDPFKALAATLLALGAIYVWWSLRTKATSKARRTVDFILIWPLILQGRRTRGEKVFLSIGVVVAILLVGLSFTLPK